MFEPSNRAQLQWDPCEQCTHCSWIVERVEHDFVAFFVVFGAEFRACFQNSRGVPLNLNGTVLISSMILKCA